MRRTLALLAGLALLCAAPADGARVSERSPARAKHATCAAKKKASQRRAARRSRTRCARSRAVFTYVEGSGRALVTPPAKRPAGALGRVPAKVPAGAPALPGGRPGPAGPAGPAASAVGDPGSATATAPAPVASTLGVNAYDLGTFVLRLTRASVPAGSLTIYFRNNDVSEHNLWLDPPQVSAPALQISGDVGENGGATRTVVVTRGTWRLYCSLPGHGSMTRDLSVG